MQSIHSNHAKAASAETRLNHEIPTQLSRLQEGLGELSRRSDALLGRLESVRRTPVPDVVGSERSANGTSPAPAYGIPQTPLGSVLDQLAREVEQQIRTVNHAIDTLEIA